MLKFTSGAIKQLKFLAKPNYILKFIIEKGGCSGAKQSLEYIPRNKLNKYDEVITIKNGESIDVAIDQHSIFKIIGSNIDYKKDDISEGFVIENPNVKSVCGCGESVGF